MLPSLRYISRLVESYLECYSLFCNTLLFVYVVTKFSAEMPVFTCFDIWLVVLTRSSASSDLTVLFHTGKYSSPLPVPYSILQ